MSSLVLAENQVKKRENYRILETQNNRINSCIIIALNPADNDEKHKVYELHKNRSQNQPNIFKANTKK